MLDKTMSITTAVMYFSDASVSSYILGIALAVLLGLVLTILNRRRKEPPGPWRLPIIGNLFLLGMMPHQSLSSLAKKYGEIFKMKLGSREVVIISDAQIAKEALIDNSRSFSSRPPFNSMELSSFEGRNVAFTPAGPQYQFHKMIAHTSLVTLMGKPALLSSYMSKYSLELVKNLTSRNSRPFNPMADVKESVAGLMYSITFDNTIPNRLKEEISNMINGSTEFIENCCLANLVDFMPWLRFFARQQLEKISKSTQNLVRFISDCLDMYKIRSIPNSEPTCIADIIASAAGRCTSKGENGEIEDVVDDVRFDDKSAVLLMTDYIGAAFEKVSTTMCWAIVYLSAHEEVQRELQTELDASLGDKLPDFSDREKLPLLLATVRETLRHSSVMPLALPHYTTSEAEISGYTIPKDTTVLLNLSAINHDPNIFPDPHRFNPHRFLDERGEPIPKSSMPFSAGERKCLGNVLAEKILFTLIGTLVKQLRFEWDDEFTPRENHPGVFGLTVRPKPFKVRVYSR